jgi:O-succinylbenzoic acid--CoA ligase
MATLRALAVPSGPCANSLLSVLAGVLDGRDAPLVPVPAGNLRESQLLTSALRVGEPIDDDIALVVPTSGTTGTPKGAMLTAAALIAGASATHDRLGGPGSWLLALPAHHIAGIQVLVRSLQAGTVPAERAAAAGVTVVRTYGSSETAGGCVYDGVPLNGVRVRIDHPADDGYGRIVIGGSTLAKGYRNPVDPDPFAEPGWFVTDDIGAVDDAGRLSVLGRADDAISTGGLTVLPGRVRAGDAPRCRRVRGVRSRRRPTRAAGGGRGGGEPRRPRTRTGRTARGGDPRAGPHRRAAGVAHHRRTPPPRDRQGGPARPARTVRLSTSPDSAG